MYSPTDNELSLIQTTTDYAQIRIDMSSPTQSAWQTVANEGKNYPHATKANEGGARGER